MQFISYYSFFDNARDYNIVSPPIYNMWKNLTNNSCDCSVLNQRL